jgi:hypothetical protein
LRELIARIPSLGESVQQARQQTQSKYRLTFQKRIDGALQDIEVGFIGGRNVALQSEQTIQTNAFRLLEIMEKATRGSSRPVLLEELPDLDGMNSEESKVAYNYLRRKALIDPSNLNYAATVSAYGLDALRDAQLTPDAGTSAFPAITYNILHVETMTGSNIQQGTAHSQITATQTITTQHFVENVQKLVDQVERALPTSDLPTEVQEQTKAIKAELRAAASERTPYTGRLRRGLEALKRIMEHAAGDLVAAGVLSLIAPLLNAAVAH